MGTINCYKSSTVNKDDEVGLFEKENLPKRDKIISECSEESHFEGFRKDHNMFNASISQIEEPEAESSLLQNPDEKVEEINKKMDRIRLNQ